MRTDSNPRAASLSSLRPQPMWPTTTVAAESAGPAKSARSMPPRQWSSTRSTTWRQHCGAVVGDVKASEAMPMLEKYFSKVPAGPRPEEMTTVEPKQFAEKSVVIREQTQPIYIEGYHRPDYHDPDDSVYDAISDILSNGRSPGSIAAWCATSRLPPSPRGSALSRRQVSRPVRFRRHTASRPYAGGDARRHSQAD